MFEVIYQFLDSFLFSEFARLITYFLQAISVVLPVMLGVAYLTYAERKILAFMHVRQGPNRVGWKGLLQPIADAVKLVFKEIIFPNQSNVYLFVIAPILAMGPAIAVWAVIPFADGVLVADINAGLLYVLAVTSILVYGVIIAGWSSNSKYAFLGAIRATAQNISYEIAMGFALVTVLMVADSMNLSEIVNKQQGGILHWFFIPLFPMFVVYFISGVAETNRAPFDVAEGESEIVAGFHVEYSGMAFAVFFLAEYAMMILISTLTAIMFLGGWLSPFEGMPGLEHLFEWVPSIFWLLAKICFLLFFFLWFRATFPRYRYDQIMRLGWKIFIPLTIIWVFVVAVMHYFQLQPWFSN